MSVVVRPVSVADHSAVLALAPRLTEVVAEWRDHASVADAERGWVEASLASAPDRDHTVLVAEDGGLIVGFCSLAVEEH